MEIVYYRTCWYCSALALNTTCLFILGIIYNTDDGSVELKEFEATPEGLIQCYTEYRRGNPMYDDDIEQLWEKDRHFWN